MSDTADATLSPSPTADPVALDVRVLLLATHFVDLHPVTLQSPATAHVVDQPLTSVGQVAQAPLAGAGTPGIAAGAVEELGAVLGVPYSVALQLVADSVELCHRLPRLWSRVHSGRLQAWRARAIARHTAGLPAAAVDFVDRQVAILADRRRLPSLAGLRDLVHEARLRVDPDRELAVEEMALARRGVWFDHQTSTVSETTTSMTAVLDAWDALDLDASLTELAGTMGSLGDRRPVDVRCSSALALMAHPQRVLDLTPADAPAAAPNPDRCGGGSTIDLHVHLGAADLVRTEAIGRSPDVRGGCALVEEVGPVLLTSLRDWLGRADRIVLRPVIDPPDPDSTATRPVDRHDPPPAMRELVVVRDGRCVFPGCQVDARRCDLDHIDAYVDPDQGGPPGQTRPDNLACLCRRHHRLKTFTAWRYQRVVGGSYAWTSPRGRSLSTFSLRRRASM